MHSSDTESPAVQQADPNEVLTMSEVAEELRCTPSTARKMGHRGELDVFWVGRHMRSTRGAVNKLKQGGSR